MFDCFDCALSFIIFLSLSLPLTLIISLFLLFSIFSLLPRSRTRMFLFSILDFVDSELMMVIIYSIWFNLKAHNYKVRKNGNSEENKLKKKKKKKKLKIYSRVHTVIYTNQTNSNVHYRRDVAFVAYGYFNWMKFGWENSQRIWLVPSKTEHHKCVG